MIGYAPDMPLSATDRYYRAETTPASITALGRGLRSAYGQPADAFGAKGNLTHTSGYHRSRDWVLASPDSRYGAKDYSVTQQLDRTGPGSDVSAFDFTPGVWGSAENRRRMIVLTTRVYRAAQARDPRLAALREFAGTLDGKTVVTFNCADGSIKSPFDSSHLDHIHGSCWRSRAAWDHAGILSVLLGGEPMSDTTKAEVNDWAGLRRLESLHQNRTELVNDSAAGPEKNGLRAALDKLQATMDEVKGLLTTPALPSPPIGDLVLTDADVDRVAEAVANELHRRSAE